MVLVETVREVLLILEGPNFGLVVNRFEDEELDSLFLRSRAGPFSKSADPSPKSADPSFKSADPSP